ncbi:uncharacterized protein PAC_18115 [Phialocephala subalpina]|uniref:Uncharacterized protein n=1 Tax=Phialocephala subalpina TaxID=576137 RepID=A0A1L7XT43_9HELO|nr:uncharacterized protein PAC_18115 [Phialocephala subalpina]
MSITLILKLKISFCIELTTCPTCSSISAHFMKASACPALPHHSSPSQPWCVKTSAPCSTCLPHLQDIPRDMYGEEKVPMSPRASGAWRRRLKIFTRLERGLGSSSPRLAGPPPTDRPAHMAIKDDD